MAAAMAVDNSLMYQYYAGICVNIITISYGAFCGWASASFMALKAPDSPLESGPMTSAEVGWVGSMLCIGGLVGTIFFAWFADRFGRKRSLLLVALPSMLGWVIICFARNPLHLAVSRFLGGFAGGGAFAVIPTYVTEFSEDRVRGTLGSFIVLSANMGILFAFVLGNYYSYVTVAIILSLLTVLFVLLFLCLPESPQYLMKHDKPEQAEMALRYFRNMGTNTTKSFDQFEQELTRMKVDEKPANEAEETRLTWKDFSNRTARKAFMIGIALMLLNQLCGCFAMITYTATIFQESGSSLPPNVCATIVAIIQLVGSYVSTMLVERAGRKLLLAISSVGSGLGLLCLGSYSHITALGYDTQSFNWVPVASFSFTIFIACWGILTLPYLVLSEILPPKIRDVCTMICLSLLWLFSWFMVMYFPIMSEVLGMHGVMFVFAGSCFLGAAFIILFIPETKGKSIDTILALL